MDGLKAIGFDLFHTLITFSSGGLEEAHNRLIKSLEETGLSVDHEAFKKAYLDAALHFIKDAMTHCRETHNSIWISSALEGLGIHIPPEDNRILKAVDGYFSGFPKHCHLIPGTGEMLEKLSGKYRLGLLSNFTHASAAMKILDHLSIRSYFDVILISGDLGYRKPHSFVFERLMDELQVEKEELVYVGDDPEPDITGALRAGIQPVWTTYVKDKNIAFKKGELGRGAEVPDDHVPRIASWDEFLELLFSGVKEGR